VLLELLENDKILVFYISCRIKLQFIHIFNLVYDVGNIVGWNEILISGEI